MQYNSTNTNIYVIKGLMSYPSVTIGFLPRERFNLAAKSLKAIFKHTHIPFNLIVIDCNTPKKYLDEMMLVLKGKSNVKIIHTDNYLTQNESRNLIVKNSKDDYIALIENDCFVRENWLSKLIDACEEFPAGVAVPLLLEGITIRLKVHHDKNIVTIKSFQKDGKKFYEYFEGIKEVNKRWRARARERISAIEVHTALFKREVFDIIGAFDEKLTVHEPIDISINLFEHNIPIVFEPASRVNFYNPPPVYDDELPFRKFIWNVGAGKFCMDYLKKKWNIVNLHDAIEFLEDQQYRTSFPRWFVRKAPKTIKRYANNFVNFLWTLQHSISNSFPSKNK